MMDTRQGLGELVTQLLDEHWPDNGVNGYYLADLIREQATPLITPAALRVEAQRRERRETRYVHPATVRSLMRRLANHMEAMARFGSGDVEERAEALKEAIADDRVWIEPPPEVFE